VTARALGKYRVLERLGRGGMGEVYVAEDTSLGRRVALKVLRPEVAGAADRRERFQREARAVAALNHPNIVTLYSVEEEEGELFLTMELVQGQSLRALLRDGPLALPRALALTAQVCEGLCTAHAAGILHRDLKPDNLIVGPDDRLKILDFGLAKLLNPLSTAAEVDALSTPGLALGTVGYMAPEQALGRPVDARADVFSLGVVLYQMLTGRPPFEGATAVAVLDHLLNRPPLPPDRLQPGLPASVASVVLRALEKDPARRPAGARELLEELRRAQGGAPVAEGSPAASSIVVLPFVDLTPEKDQEYFCHGVAEELIHSLARVPGLRVISRTSAFAFQGQAVDITEIGRRLRAGTALEGSVRRSGSRVRISTRLVSTEDGFQLWSKRFDRQVEDVFAVEDEIAETIVGELAELQGVSLRRAAPRNSGAYDAYLHGTYALNKWSEEWVRKGIGFFQDALARDPEFAPAHAGLAECHLWLYSGVGIAPAAEAVPPARAAVERALQLDPLLAAGHRLRGMIAMNHDWDRRGAEQGLRRAVELAPGSAETRLANAWRLALLESRYDEALADLAQAERLGPLDLQVKTQIGYVHYFLHDLDRAVAQFERVLATDATIAFAHYALGDALTQRGEYARAIRAYETSAALGGRTPNHVAVLGYAQGRAGQDEAARALLAELTGLAAAAHVSPMWMALVHVGLGENDAAFAWLDRACAERDGSLILITAAIEFDPLRADPRFTALLEKMGLQAGETRSRIG
jgi:eukaryotic-like serine/threonine-protein kinase